MIEILVFDEKQNQSNTTEEDTNVHPDSRMDTPSLSSSPTVATKSTNLEETESSNDTQGSTESTTNRSRNIIEFDVPDTRQTFSDIDIKTLSDKIENREREV